MKSWTLWGLGLLLQVVPSIIDASIHKVTMLDSCDKEIDASNHTAGLVTLTNEKHYPNLQNCKIIFKLPKTKYFILTLKSLDIEQTIRCDKDYLRVYDGLEVLPRNKVSGEGICGKLSKGNNPVIVTETNGFALEFSSNAGDNYGEVHTGFELVYTPFHYGECNGFECPENARCIDKSLKCDGYNNCGKSEDELNAETGELCPTSDSSQLHLSTCIVTFITTCFVGAFMNI